MKPDAQNTVPDKEKQAVRSDVPTEYPYDPDFDGVQDVDGYEPEVDQ